MERDPLLNLIDAMVKDIMETPIEELETEIRMRGEDPAKLAARMRETLAAAVVVRAKAEDPSPASPISRSKELRR